MTATESPSVPEIYKEEPFAKKYDALQLVFEVLLKKNLIKKLCASLVAHSEGQTIETIVDFGTGTRRMLKDLETSFPKAQLIGLDGSPAMLGQQSSHSDTNNLAVAETQYPPIADGSIDIATACMATSYTEDPMTLLGSMASTLKVGGLLGLIDSRLPRIKAIQELSLAANAMYGDTPETVHALTQLYAKLVGDRKIELRAGGNSITLELVQITGDFAENWGFFGCVLRRTS